MAIAAVAFSVWLLSTRSLTQLAILAGIIAAGAALRAAKAFA